jgi:hypothetical protein
MSAYVRVLRCGALSDAPFGGHITRSGAIRLLLGVSSSHDLIKFIRRYSRLFSLVVSLSASFLLSLAIFGSFIA